MSADFPAALPTSIIDGLSAGTLAALYTNDSTRGHATLHIEHIEEILATDTKIGTGASTPIADSVLRGTAAGVSSWSATPTLTGLTTGTITSVANTLAVGGAGTNLSVTTTNTVGPRLSLGGGTTFALRSTGAGDSEGTNRLVITNTGGATNLMVVNSSGDSQFPLGNHSFLMNRRGGSATSWPTAGTTNYTDIAFMQAGSVTSSAAGTTAVTFPVAFTETPLMIATVDGATNFAVTNTITTTGFNIDAFTDAGARAASTTMWFAIGTVAAI
jgi:hypothetical protein